MRRIFVSLIVAFGVAASNSVLAQPENKPGHGRGGPPDHGTPSSQPSGQISITISEHDRNTVYGYYRAEHAAGHCPPGLAKKGNGCLPPGQAKKLWTMGQPLPAGVLYYPLPPDLLGRLSPAPAGYQYVRVASDVLMMAVGTRLIVGALADLGSL